MDKRKSILNVSVSVTFKIITMVMAVVVKRFLIQICGNEVNGLNALYLSVIGFLAVAELGVGSAISFCMYRPIVDNNEAQVAALYRLFKRVYTAVAVFILAAGLLITPFIHLLASDYAEINVNLYSTFVLMLISVVITYPYSAKTSLINAYKNNYITTAITSGGIVLQYVLQLGALLVFGTFEAYLCCRIIAALAQWLATDVIARKKYGRIMVQNHAIDEENRYTLIRSIKAMFMHQIGSLLVNTVDSIVISVFVGVVALGEYSNYTMILSSMTGIIIMVFNSLVSVVGHFYAKRSKVEVRIYFEMFHLINFMIGVVFYLGYYAIVDELVSLLFGSELVMDRAVIMVMTLNGFVQFMRRFTIMFREATGTFYYDRWRPIFEGTVNIMLSILFVKAFDVVGVIVATLITSLLICHVVEPQVIYRHALDGKPAAFYLRNYGLITLFFVLLKMMDMCMQHSGKPLHDLFINGFISVGVSFVACTLSVLMNIGICKRFIGIKHNEM